MDNEQVLHGPNEGELPNWPRVTLTEAITWITAGICHDDDKVDAEKKAQHERDSAEWGDPLGPAYLKTRLEQLQSGSSLTSDVGLSPDLAEIERAALAKTESWLAAKGMSPDQGYKLVCRELEQRACDDEKMQRLQNSVFRRCALRQITLLGTLNEPESRSDGSPTEIPASFFAKRAAYIMGTGFRGKGELCRASSNGKILPPDFDRDSDPRPTYQGVMIDRDVVCFLKREFDREEAQDRRDRLFKRVRQGELTPDDAEAEARQQGIGPLNPTPDAAQFNPMTLSRWSLAMTLAWIAWRTPEDVRWLWDDYRSHVKVWQIFKTAGPEDGDLRVCEVVCLATLKPAHGTYSVLAVEADELTASGKGPRVSVDEAERLLWTKLQDECLNAEGLDPTTGKRVTIPSCEFHDLYIECDLDGEDYLTSRENALGYRKPTLKRADVMRLWPPQSVDPESQCLVWLIEQMKKSPKERPKRRRDFEEEALRSYPGLRKEAFCRSWKEAIKSTGATAWMRSGRPRRESSEKPADKK